MEKILVCLLTLVMLLSLCACGKTVPETMPPLVVDETAPTEMHQPTEDATLPPTEAPTEAPTEVPTEEPTEEPTEAPTEEPTEEVTVPAADPAPELTYAQQAFGEAVAQTARDQVGDAYVYGGSGPSEFDNSGLIYYCFKANDLSVPRVTNEQAEHGYGVEWDSLYPGDVLFFWESVPGEAGFCGIYIGDSQMVMCSSSKGTVRQVSINNSYYQEHFSTARRYMVE